MSMCQAALPRAAAIAIVIASKSALSAPPSSHDVDVYSSLCKIGSQTTVVVSGELGAISRRILAGEGKLSASKLQDEFPGIRDEKKRLLALQSFQDCMYRYVDKFHMTSSGTNSSVNVAMSPGVPTERRREIVYLANELEAFKTRMASVVSSLPASFYDRRDSKDKKPREDSRLIGLSDFSRYKAFQSASGGLDFSNATNGDIVILCTTYSSEMAEYNAFSKQYKPLSLPPYGSSAEVKRICTSAARGR